MSKKYFQCPDHGPIDADDIVIPEIDYGEPLSVCMILLHRDCGKSVSEIPDAWKTPRPFTAWELELFRIEKLRAFAWAASVTLFVLAVYFLYRNFERSQNLPAFTLDALKHWRLPW